MPIMLEALVGGVGNVWARSIEGLPAVGCGATECEGWERWALIGFAIA